MAATPNVQVRPARLIARDSSVGAQEDFSPVGFIDPTRTTVQGGWGQPTGSVAVTNGQVIKVGVVEAIGYTGFTWILPAGVGGGSYFPSIAVANEDATDLTSRLNLTAAAITYNLPAYVVFGNLAAPAAGSPQTGGLITFIVPMFTLYIVDSGAGGIGGTLGGFGKIYFSRQ